MDGYNEFTHKIVPWKFRRKHHLQEGTKINTANKSIKKIFLVISLVIILYIKPTHGQIKGLFPAIKDLSSFTDVKASSTCGLNDSLMTYCISNVEDSSIQSCTQRTCLFNCCPTCGTKSPSCIIFDNKQKSNGVFVSSERHPYNKVLGSNSWNFQSNGFIQSSIKSESSNFSFTSWIKQEKSNDGVLLHKANVFTISLQNDKVTFEYFIRSSPTIRNKIEFVNVIFEQGEWFHLALVICAYDISLFIDGIPTRSSILSGLLNNKLESLRVGQNTQGSQYKGLMQDIKFYSKGITNREVIESQTGLLPDVSHTNCRCPESHPRISATNTFHCMKNGPVTSHLVERLSKESHVPEFLVDGEAITYWISEQVNDAFIEIDLKYSKLQVFLVSILFYSPPAEGMKIERSLDFGKSYQAWQYFAVDCLKTFKMADNGQLPEPDSVNCIKVPNPRSSWESIAFQPAEPGPDTKPQRPFGVAGCNDFYCSPELLKFVEATNVKITLTGHSLVNHADHQYFGIRRIVVGGNCDCFGHATQCDYNETTLPHPSYTCQCDPRTFTHGDQCDKCLPLYNDKRFARGTILNANPCKKCNCNNHADECYYDPTQDTDPLDRSKPGGGVCIGCKHNTFGRHCQVCKALYYRPTGRSRDVANVCEPCNCIGPGILNGNLECEKDDSNGKLAGQCKCKKYAAGRQCTECAAGYYFLSPANPDGCSTCGCNTPGTVNNGISCHISSGQCSCKKHVIGVKCTNCKLGYFGLSAINPEGCLKCDCSSLGSDLTASCSSLTGQCTCKEKYRGRQCNECVDGYFGPTCQPCNCNAVGVVPGSTSCSQDDGQCKCKRNVDGISCDRCKVGYYGLSTNNAAGCMACTCDSKGTIGNTGQCDQRSGVCTCKALVTGQSCSLCKVGTYGLAAAKSDGCTSCNCDPKGTVAGDTTPKDQLVCTSGGKCSCLFNVEGDKCDRCLTRYYWNPKGLGCLSCSCDPQGSLSSTCSASGQCQCRTSDGLTGPRCNECQLGYYGYTNGRCTPCGCSPAGRVGIKCNDVGVCTQCKRNVEGTKCNLCKQGSKNLDNNNPYGCSGIPNQQGPPRVTAKTSTSISLAWAPPDDPNGVITGYQLKRNDSTVYTGSKLSFVDASLSPFASHVYYVYSSTAAGSARSVDSLVVRTDSDVPQGISPPTISDVKDRSVVASWGIPTRPNGIITRYLLRSERQSQSDSGETTHYIGLLNTVQVTGLDPFTVYNFSIAACNVVGCVRSLTNTAVSTRSAAPDSQPAPYISLGTGGTSVIVTWDAPSQPNGEINFYELFQRASPFTGQGNSAGVQLKPENRTISVTGLLPYTEYEFRIVSQTTQVEGSTSSNWTRIRTMEGAPSGQSKPSIIASTSSTMTVSWTQPSSPAGIITRYEVYQYDARTSYLVSNLIATVTNAQQTRAQNLAPYTVYQFTVKSCNSYSCTSHSSKVSGQTLASVPENQPPPIPVIHNSTTVSLAWVDPTRPNGPLPVNFRVSMTKALYNTPPAQVVPGVQFSGLGYYRFSGSHIPDSAENLITLWFKTRFPDGLLLFASSKGQEDLIAIELRSGKPWFIFDTESGPAAFTIQSSSTFNDNQWHHIQVSRDMQQGQIAVDRIHKGSGSSNGDKNVIGQIAAIYIGGLPRDYVITRADSGSATIARFPFIGCVRDILFKNIPLDFKTYETKASVPPLSDHCSVYLQDGIYFKGYGHVVLNQGVFNGGPNFRISFKLMTSLTDALILYCEGVDAHFIIFITDKILYLQYKQPAKDATKFTLSTASTNLCNNKHHEIVIENKARRLSATIDGGVAKTIATLTSDMAISSETYIGGVPKTVDSLVLKQFEITSHLSGCMRDLNIGSPVNLQHSVKSYHNVEFNGCPSVAATQQNAKLCHSPKVATVYDGPSKKTLSGYLNPFTEYLFRVSSYHQNVDGASDSEWVVVRTGDGVPSGLSKPTLKKNSAKYIEVTWSPPDDPNGLVTIYTLRVYHVINNKPTKVADIDVTNDNFTKIVSGLIPATIYGVTIDAMTSAGGIESAPLSVKTFAAAPEGFDAPLVARLPTSLNITWTPPRQPNGQILFYQLELNGQTRYNGQSTNAHVDKLSVYTLYTVKLTVCGEIGCTSTQTDVYTGELPPDTVIAPQVKILGNDRVSVSWSVPSKPNGLITKYQVYKSKDTSTQNLVLVFNATATTMNTMVNNLTPGSVYYFRIKAYTVAGGTLGDAAMGRTLESVPSGIPQPTATPYNSTTILVSLFPPVSPNGVITEYRVIQNGAVVMKTAKFPSNGYVADGLRPFSRHVFRIEVCTSKGCGSSDSVTSYTEHGIPKGTITLIVSGIQSRSINTSWTAIAEPNGQVNYTVYAAGEFYTQPGGVDFETTNRTEVCYSGDFLDGGGEIQCAGLLPKAHYEIRVNGSNDVGFVLSNRVEVLTKADVPDGVMAPRVQAVNSTSVTLSWPPVRRSNGVIRKYSLHVYYPVNGFGSDAQAVLKEGMFFTYTVTRLEPHTVYGFWLVAENEVGSSTGPRTNVTTLEDVPSSVDAPKLSFTGARRVVVEISPPAKPNGIVTEYKIYLNNTLINTTRGDEREIEIANLTPYADYQLYFKACTAVGCTNSPHVKFRTIQDVPEGVFAPILEANGSRSVIVRWYEPKSINGIIVCYIVQRIKGSASTPTNMVKLNASFWNTYHDGTVVPHTFYRYRIVAYTSVGGTPSPYNTITTPQAPPEGLLTPTISNITQTSFTLHWKPPSVPNGDIRHYLVSVTSDSTRKEIQVANNLHTFEVTDLSSYVEYSALIKACNGGGCGSSGTAKARTSSAPPKLQPAPYAVATGNTSLRVRWQEPRDPNGPIVKYELMHRTIESLLTESIDKPTPWLVVYEGTTTVFTHTALGVYSKNQYKVTCYTTEGNTTSGQSDYYRTGAGIPIKGPSVAVQVVNHTSVRVSWTDPPFRQLKGAVQSYTVTYEIVGAEGLYVFGTLPSNASSTVVNNLKPSTGYDFRVSLYNGAGSINSEPIRAKTLAGVPDGFEKPTIYRIEAKSIRVSWQPPKTPNGDVMNYTIIANDKRMDTVSSTTTFHHQTNLKPFTEYTIKIQVCTNFMCILSPAERTKTSAAEPENLAVPSLKPLSGTSIEVKWGEPSDANGMMVGYYLYRRTTLKCPAKEKPVRKCTFISCQINEQLCGPKCYDPKIQTCCEGSLHPKHAQKTCCGSSYLVKGSSSDVCCGGKFYPKQDTYQCCHGYYRQILNGQVCCLGNNNNNGDGGGVIVVGNGDSCCGDVPYRKDGEQICLCGGLYKKEGNVRQCCGNRVVSIAETCCGTGEYNDIAHAYDASKVCCGTSYVVKDTSLCCVDDVNQFKFYNYTTGTQKSQHKCCGTNRIPTSANCCNQNAYSNATEVCADRSSDLRTTGCGQGLTCPVAQRSTAYCDQCQFDPSNRYCGHVTGFYNTTSGGTTNNNNTSSENKCHTSYTQILLNTNNPYLFRFVDTKLAPHTRYEYYVMARNLVGNTTSASSAALTFMARPEELHAPVPTVLSSNQIAITWSPPQKPNGVITKYTLYRTKWSTKQEMVIYTGLASTHTDEMQLEPFTGYMYTLGVCTNLCANISAINLAYTEESAPEDVIPPSLIPLSSTSILVNWITPAKPNGVITRYNVTMKLEDEKDSIYQSILPPNNLGESKFQIVSNMKPFTNYTFRVEACTKIGCAFSAPASRMTLEAVPEGLEAPRVLVLSATKIHLEWDKPNNQNGVLKYYVILRNGTVVYNTTSIASSARVFIDSGVRPAKTYTYAIRAHNEAGGGASPPSIVTTPESSPEGIHVPVLRPLTSVSINVTWKAPSIPNGIITSYYVLHQEIDGPITREQNTGPQWWHVIKDLKPFTFYNVRIEACTQVGCGIGTGALSRTNESRPFGQSPPSLMPQTSTMVEIKWSVPSTPNGLLTEYLVERRDGQDAGGMPFKIYIGLRLQYIDSQLKPYTVYQYRVHSRNSAGNAVSSWASVQTLEAAPQAIQVPRINAVNGTAVEVEWSKPGVENGVISRYLIRYRLFSLTGTSFEEVCCFKPGVFKTMLNVFKPATRYELLIGAATSAGVGLSSWTLFTTKEAPPSSVPALKANTDPLGTNDGTIMEISWDEPAHSNGIITKYVLHDQYSVVYEGLARTALVRKLQPYTNYTFRLVVFNSAGYLSGPFVTLRSGEVTPRGQLPPTVTHVESGVELVWKEPLFPHGNIVKYEIIREEVSAKRRRRAADAVVIATVDGSTSDLKFVDTTVKPFTKYRYKIRTINSQGKVDSEWIYVTTPQAAPDGVHKVNVTSMTDTKVHLSWLSPSTPNGIVNYYNIFRNGSRIDTISSHEYTDISGLQPSTFYSYQIEACTAGGCTMGPVETVKTLETAPGEISPPSFSDITPTSVVAHWQAPRSPNGVVSKYKLYEATQRVPLFEGVSLEYKVSGLQVYTRYSFRVAACTSRGCTSSVVSFVTTSEDTPEQLAKPDLYVIGPTAIDIRWSKPEKPNGVIRFYIVKRTLQQNAVSVVYNGTDRRFTDRTVNPGTSYGYSVEAHNSAGFVGSPITYSERTGASAPEDVKSPQLEALTPTNILAKWDSPGKPNGVIVVYFVLYDGGKSVNVGTANTYTVSNLSPYTEYSFRVKACTSLTKESDCATSLSSTARTKEAPPEQQNPPSFEAKHIKGNSVQAAWQKPLQPNGNIVRYVLFRRNAQANASKVYDGPALSFTDATDIRPKTRYEYKVVAYNGVGSTESSWSAVTTDNSHPTGVFPLSVNASTVVSTSATVMISPPREPNGEIQQYLIQVSETNGGGESRNISIGPTQTNFVIKDLKPQTRYELRLYACNEVGCGASDITIFRTKQPDPAGFGRPRISSVTSSSFNVSWEPPKIPNGIVLRYDVKVEYRCPQPSVPSGCVEWVEWTRNISALPSATLSFNVILLDPYAKHYVTVTVQNEAGSVKSETIEQTTLAADPKLQKESAPSLSISPTSSNAINIDWSKSFHVNGPIIEYIMYENDVSTVSAEKRVTYTRTDRTPGTYRYKVSLTTLVGNTEKTVTSQEASITVTSDDGGAPITSFQISEKPWYETVWFLALCALAGLLILFLLVVCCCRGYGKNRTVYVRQREPLATKKRFGVRGEEQEFSDFPPNLKPSTTKLDPDTIYQDGVVFSPNVDTRYISTHELIDGHHGGRSHHFNGGEGKEFPREDEDGDFIWDQTNDDSRDFDSGLYDDDGISPNFTEPEIETTQDGFVSLQQERLMFPDTHL